MSIHHDSLVRRYRYLFKLPDTKIIIPIYLSTITFIAYTLASDTSMLPIVILSSYTSCIADLSILYFKRYDPILKIRRILALSSISNAIIILYILGVIVAIGRSATVYAIQSSICIAVYLRTLVIWSISKVRHLWKSILALQPTILCYSTMVWLNRVDFIPLLWSILGFAISLSILKMIERRGMKTTGLSFPRYFYGFLLCWMEGDHGVIEELLDNHGSRSKARIAILLFKTRERLYAAVIPFIHSGPFLNVGSSYMPSKLKSIVESVLNVDCAIVFHGASTHENDLTSSKYYERIAEAVSTARSRIEFKPVKISSIMEISDGEDRCIGHLIDKVILLCFTRAPKHTEDIPLSIQEEFSNISKRIGLDAIYIIDCHNSIESREGGDEYSYASIRSLAFKMIEILRSTETYPASIAIATNPIEDYTPTDGVGPGGVTVALFKTPGRLEGYIVYDSNNMLPKLREAIISSMRDRGLSYIEVFTTDTHAVTGMVTGRGYKPLGEGIPFDRIIATTIKVFEEAKAKLEPIEGFDHIEVEVDDVKIIGRGFLERIDKLTETCISYARKLIPTTIILINILIMAYIALLV
ncbi:MAG: DUF2070 family protein [Candidatus Bathyarchaeia archaeon]